MSPRDAASVWPFGGSELARLIRERDWATTPIGPTESWPQSLRTLVDLLLGSPTMMCLMWGPSALLLYNEAYARSIGEDHPGALGRSAFEVWPDMWGHFEPSFRRALTGEGAVLRNQHLPARLPARPHETWFDLTYAPVRDESGDVAGVMVSLTETTERVLSDRALRESEARYRLALEAAQAIVYDWDCRTDDVDRGGNLEGIVGFRPSEVPKDAGWWSERVHPDDRGRLISSDPSRIAPGVTLAETEYRVRHRDEHWVHVLDRRVAIREPDGMVRIVGSTIDVTARAVAEAALRESERRQAFLLELGDALRAEPDADAVADRALRMLSDELRLDRCYVGTYRLAEDRADLTHQVGNDRVPPVPASVRLSDFPAALQVMFDRTLIIDDVAEAEGLTGKDRQNMAALGYGALVAATLRKGEGRPLWSIVAVSAQPRRWTPGEVALMEAATERTWTAMERARAEATLRELNETLEARVSDALAERKLLADVFEGTDAMISVADTDLRLLAFNRPYADEVEKLGGRRPRVGDHIPDLYAGQPELAAPAEANWRRAVAGDTFAVTEEHGNPACYRRSYERRFEPIRDREGRLIGAYQYATDVTEQLRDQRRAEEAEAARRDADALYRAYFENSGEALFVVGVLPDGGLTFEQVNPAHRAALGFDIAAEPGKRIEEVLPPEVAAGVAANYERVLETGELQRYRESAELGGRVIHTETVLVPVRDETGRIVRIVGSGRDMTAQVQAEEALRQSQKMDAMGQLTGGVAHDFNNLLTPILGGLDRLQRKGVGDERDRKMIEGALQSAERARTLVQRLLAFARRQPLQPTAVNVTQVVQGMAELVSSTTGPQIKVAVEVNANLSPALADANQLEMAILNLAVNARDAMPDGGTLRISATNEAVAKGRRSGRITPGRYVRLSVADTGTGMDEATLARAVEPFFSTKGVGRGTGLGLSMVHGLATQLGGALTIQSKPGLGTNVELWLPVAGADIVAGTAPSKSAGVDVAPQVHGTALLVDDELLVRATAADMLNELGYAVVEAGSADEALRRMDEGIAPDLVITDHLMPGLTGTEFARILQARDPDLPVLIISGYAEVDGIAPDLPRLTKPFLKSELAAILQRPNS